MPDGSGAQSGIDADEKELRTTNDDILEARHALAWHFPPVCVVCRGAELARVSVMSKLLRGLAAGYGAKKLGGGCLGTVIVFIVLWYLLGHFQIFR